MSSANLLSNSCASLCFPLVSGEGIGTGCVKAPLFGFLIVLGLVGLEWEELDDDEFFFWMRGERRGGGREV